MSIEKKLEELTTAINSLAVAILNQPQPTPTPAPAPAQEAPAPAPQPEPAPAQEAPAQEAPAQEAPAPKARRKRRTKAEIEAEAQDDPAPATAPAQKAATLSFQDVKSALLDLMKAQGAVAAKTILKTVGKVENVSALQEADYPAVMDAIQDKLGQGEIF